MLCPCPLSTRALKKTKTTTVQMSRTTAYLGGGKAAIPWRNTHHHVSVQLISLRKTDPDRARSPGFCCSSQPTPRKECNYGVEIHAVVTKSLNIYGILKCLRSLRTCVLPSCRSPADWCREPSPPRARAARLPEKGGKMLSRVPLQIRVFFLVKVYSCPVEQVS